MTHPPVSVAALRAGHVLGGRFEIVGVLGEGGSGIVYDAVALGDGARRPVALKVIHGHLVGDEQIRKRFAREAAILRRMEGAHLCPVLDFGELPAGLGDARPLLFLALPKIDGPALDAVLREEGALGVDRAVGLALQICDGLSAAHAEGVIHRDLKPGNVLLEGGSVAIVIDFGMAKIVTGEGADATVLTQRNMVFGTPEYMAPEQARGDELDARCDVYALGVVLYEMLAGEAPFAGATALSVLSAHLAQPPPPLLARAPHVPVALEAVVMHALAKSPADRYASAASMRLALGRALASPGDPDAVAPARSEVPRSAHEALGHAATIPIPAPTPPAGRRGPLVSPAAERGSGRRLPARAPSLAPPSGSRMWLYVWASAVAIGLAVGVWLGVR